MTVYWVKAGDTGPVKVGHAANVPARIRELQTGCPWPLILLRTEPGDRDLEGALHCYYRARQVRAEWFLLTNAEVQVSLDGIRPPPRVTALPGVRLNVIEQFILEVEEFCRTHGVSEAAFGRLATNNPKFLSRLRRGIGTSRLIDLADIFMIERSAQARTSAPASAAA